MSHLTGSCLCGRVKFRVPDEFGFIGYCHCSECRKWSGSAFASGGSVGFDELEITDGEELVSYYRKTEQTDLGFCSHCGSSLFSKKLQRGLCIVRLGVLDDVPTQRPNVHIFFGSKAPWFDTSDQLEKFDTAPQ